MSSTLKLTVAEYDRMVERGAFEGLTKKIELLNGVICEMNPAGPVHDYLIEYLNNWSVRGTDPEAVRVRIQSGLSLPELESRPEPDVLWVKANHPRDRHPQAADVLLLIEVSYSSLKSDQSEKESLYAAAEIPEYWIVDVKRQQIHVHRDPNAGLYRSIQIFDTSQSIAPLAEHSSELNIAQLFGV